MLYYLNDLHNAIKKVPFKNDYLIWKNRLTKEEYNGLFNVLTVEVDKVSEQPAQKQFLTSSFLPGSDWTNTPYQIIYEKACVYNEQHAAFFFGLILMDVIIQHKNKWCSVKLKSFVEKGIKGSTYFRMHDEE